MNQSWQCLLPAILMLGSGMAGADAPSDQPPEDRTVLFVNESPHAVVRIFTTRVSSDGWYVPILLGGGALLPGQSIRTEIEYDRSLCLFDVRAEFEGGRSATGQVNVCRDRRYAIAAPAGDPDQPTPDT